MTQQGYQSREGQSHILNSVCSFVFEILSKVPSVVTCHKFNTKKVQSYKSFSKTKSLCRRNTDGSGKEEPEITYLRKIFH